jgi:hypothetical protein
MPKNDQYIAPPYGSIGGHIVALNGVTDDGRVVVTDSTSVVGKDGYLEQWRREDFEKIWMRNKGGVGMVISTPSETVKNLRRTPAERVKRLDEWQVGNIPHYSDLHPDYEVDTAMLLELEAILEYQQVSGQTED